MCVKIIYLYQLCTNHTQVQLYLSITKNVCFSVCDQHYWLSDIAHIYLTIFYYLFVRLMPNLFWTITITKLVCIRQSMDNEGRQSNVNH